GAIGINAAENDSAAANLAVINDDKASQRRNAIVIIDYEWCSRLDREPPHFVSIELFTLVLNRLERRRIHHLIDRHDFAFHLLRREPKIIKATDSHGFAHDPKDI